MADDDELQTFLQAQRRRRIKAIGLFVVAIGGGTALYLFALKQTPCERLAQELCNAAGMSCTTELAQGLNDNIPQDACAESLATMEDAIDAAPAEYEVMIRAQVMRELIQEQLGVDPLTVE